MAKTNGSWMNKSNDIVLTGMSGRLPESNNIEEFAEQLFAGVDLVTVTERRWAPGLYGLPERSGTLKDLKHFDASFFNMHSKQAHVTDPQLRLLLEVTYEAIVDAGYNPTELRGPRTGVYVGCVYSECDKLWTANTETIKGYALTGCNLAMFSNRVSYCFDFKGPSLSVDATCSSSMLAFNQAVDAIRSGLCDAAIVGGTNLCLQPEISLLFQNLNMLSQEGRCAVFDENANGYVRSEAVVAVLLQKRSVARRVYCTVRGARSCSDGFKPQGITFPSVHMQCHLIDKTLEEAELKPQDIVYIEAHGTGTKIGDPQEMAALLESYCKSRQHPLLVGSVKSNIGHPEATSGLCSIVKVILAMERGIIPGNLHYKKPNKDIIGLFDGRIKVVDKNMAWTGGIVASNSFGVGGTNVHVILEAENDRKSNKLEVGALPRLVLTSGRTEAAARSLVELAVRHKCDDGLLALLNAAHSQATLLHGHRAYCLLSDPPQQGFFEVTTKPRPIWFIFSGMGSQWTGMGCSLMKIPVFASSIKHCAAVLKPHGIDLEHVLFEATGTVFDDVINSFVSITSVQVALVDVLRSVNINPDGMIGFSVGEIGCAYADETLSAEQAVLVAYWRGRSIIEAKLPRGAMASVGLSWEQCIARCPSDIVIACNNAADNVTTAMFALFYISGPVESIDKFVTELKAEGVFTRHVNSSGIAFHSKYIEAAAPLLQSNLQSVIPEPKPRTSKWLSTSLPPDQWGSEVARLSDAAYHVNNFLSPVRFMEALASVPEHALLVELAPHAILQAVLRRARPAPTVHVALLRREAKDTGNHLLAALGCLYGAGALPQVAALYPSVSWPVPRGTPGISSHIKWNHDEEWAVAQFGTASFPGIVFEYDISTSEGSFLAGHNIDGRILFPAAGFIYLILKTMTYLLKKKLENIAIVLKDMHIKRTIIMPREGSVRFSINVMEGSGEFEISEGDSVVVTGYVRLAENPENERLSRLVPPTFKSDLLLLLTNDVYKELRLKGYNYSGVFCGIQSVDAKCNTGELRWNNNWIAFIDTMIQIKCLGLNTRELFIPTYIDRVFINPMAHISALDANKGVLSVHIDHKTDVIQSDGIELQGCILKQVKRATITQNAPKLQTCLFVPYDNTNNTDSIPNALLQQKAITIILQILLENIVEQGLKIIEIVLERSSNTFLLPVILDLLDNEPRARVDTAMIVTNQNASSSLLETQTHNIKIMKNDFLASPPAGEWHLLVCVEILSRRRALVSMINALKEGGLVLTEEKCGATTTASAALEEDGLVIVARQVVNGLEYVMLRRMVTLPPARILIELDDERFEWVEQIRVALKRAEREPMRVYAVSYSSSGGALGLANCLRGEPGGHTLRCFHLSTECERFDFTAPLYAKQLAADLSVNVLNAGIWGSYRHLPFATNIPKQVEHAYVNILTRGNLSSLGWIESDLQFALTKPVPPDSDFCKVYYAPLNFRDIMVSTGKLPLNALPKNIEGQTCVLGLEYSGRTSEGKRVMGMVAARGLASTVLAPKSFMWDVPESWTLEQASTVPVAYATAYYALCVRGHMRRGETVLVHAGAGAVGQAAITIALFAGCSVFTTVSTPHKRTFLQKRFPALPPQNIGHSRNCSFEQLIITQTHGRGVDLVLNSLAGDKLQASLRCLADGGRFLEIGKLDLSQNTALGMSIFLRNITFHGILLDSLFENSDNEEKSAVVRCVSEGIASGVVQPLPSTVFTDEQLEQAFRYMATGQHIGKVVLRVREEEETGTRLIAALPRVYMHPGKSYVLVGGLGGLGLELAQWLVTRGATALIFNSRSGVRTGYQALCICRWREKGVKVLVSTADCTTRAGACALLREASSLAPVGGVFNLAAVLRDAFLENLTADDFRVVAKPKINVTKALDDATRDFHIATALEYFVVFSSVVSSRGNPGQSNYGYANSAMEDIIRRRHANGLPGLAIQWGSIDDVGIITEASGPKVTHISGTTLQRVSSCLETLDVLLAERQAVLESIVMADKHRTVAANTQSLVHTIASILGIKDPNKASKTSSLAELGMDSLMSSEIKQILDHKYNLVLGAKEIRKLTFKDLQLLADNVEKKTYSVRNEHIS